MSKSFTSWWCLPLCLRCCLHPQQFLKLLNGRALEMTWWNKMHFSIVSMQIEKEVLHLPVDFRKAQWKTWYMHPFPLAIHFLWKDDSYIRVSQIFEANTWQQSDFFFFFPHWAAEIRDPKDITEFTLFPLLPVLPLLLSSEGSVWPPNTPDTLCCYFHYKISIQGLLDASRCLLSSQPTRLSLNVRQIEHFWNWHFSGSIPQHHGPC